MPSKAQKARLILSETHFVSKTEINTGRQQGTVPDINAYRKEKCVKYRNGRPQYMPSKHAPKR